MGEKRKKFTLTDAKGLTSLTGEGMLEIEDIIRVSAVAAGAIANMSDEDFLKSKKLIGARMMEMSKNLKDMYNDLHYETALADQLLHERDQLAEHINRLHLAEIAYVKAEDIKDCEVDIPGLEEVAASTEKCSRRHSIFKKIFKHAAESESQAAKIDDGQT